MLPALLSIRASVKIDDYTFEPVDQLVAWEDELDPSAIFEYIKDTYSDDIFDGHGHKDAPTARVEVWIRTGEDTHLIYPVSLTEDIYDLYVSFDLINQNKHETIYRD